MSTSTQIGTLNKSQELLALLQTKFPSNIRSGEISLNDVVISVNSEDIFDLLKLLKLDSQLQFNLLVDITVVDWMDSRDKRFEVVYHLMSLSKLYRLRVKAQVAEKNPNIASVVSLWSGANYLEREAWDMYGVNFLGHPDQRRILMYDEFVGHPLRKDYPVQGKQPRIPLRSPEVRNTALDMQRPELVNINRKTSSGSHVCSEKSSNATQCKGAHS